MSTPLQPASDEKALGKPLEGWRLRLYTIIFEADTRAGQLFDRWLLAVILLSLAVEGLYRPIWSQAVLDELIEAEAEKLDGWADDLKIGLEREIRELDRQIKEARRAARLAVSLEEKLASQKRMKALESERNTRRRALFESQDEIDSKRGALIAQLEAQLTQKVTSECLFSVPWRVV